MTDQFPKRQTESFARAGGSQSHIRMLAAAAVAISIVGAAVVWRVTEPVAPKREAVAVRNPALDELLASTKALESSQQQAIDQLQSLQDAVASQQADTKRATDQVALLSGKLESLRQSFASATPPTTDDKEVDAVAAKPKASTAASAAPARKIKHWTARSRGSAHRVGVRKPRSVAAKK